MRRPPATPKRPASDTPPAASSAGRERLALGAVLALFALTGLSVLPVPFTRDQGVYAYTAWRWLSGGVPYLDSFDHKGPLLYAIYAAGLEIAGGRMWGVNLLDLLARAGTIAFVWAIARRLLSARAALLAASLTALPLLGTFNAAWVNAQAETFTLPLLAAAAWLVAGGGGRRRIAAAAAAGFLAGQAMMLKPTAALSVLFLVGWLAWRGGGGDAPRRGWRAASAFSGAAVAAVAAWLLYFAARGALGRMGESLVLFNAIHAGSGAGAQAGGWRLATRWIWPLFNLAPALALGLLLPTPGAAGSARGGSGTAGGAGRLFAAGWLLAGVAQVIVQAKYFQYHWLAAAVPLGLATGAGLDAAVARLTGPQLSAAAPGSVRRRSALGRQAVGTIVMAALLVWLAGAHGARWVRTHAAYRTWAYVTREITPQQYEGRFREAGPGGRSDFNLPASRAAASAARDAVPPSGRLLVFGFEPLVNYLAARAAPTRFVFDYPLTFPPGSPRAARLRERWRAEFLADLRAQPHTLLLLVALDVAPLELRSSVAQAREFTEFWAWLQAGYVQAGELEDFVFFTPRR